MIEIHESNLFLVDPPRMESAKPLLRVLSLEVIDRLEALEVPLGVIDELSEIHERLWALEDSARARDATIRVKRAIDAKNAHRHKLIDRLSECFAELAQAENSEPSERRSYSETPGELCDRLVILDIKIRNSAVCQADAGLSDEVRRRCAESGQGLRAWRKHLQEHLVTMLDDVRYGQAQLPPRREFKMYNDPQLNPALRHPGAGLTPAKPVLHTTKRSASAAHRPIRHILGVAPTGHGASLAYLGPGGVVRASVLDRWAGTKNTLLFAREEAQDILAGKSQTDTGIYDALTYTYGRFPTYREFEDDFPAWFDWLTRDQDVTLADIDLVVTSESHFATCSARLGPELRRWLPNSRVVTEPEHHRIHQCQAFWASGLPAAGVMTLDTCGEDLNRLDRRQLAGTIARMERNGEWRTLREFFFPETSVGILYAVFNHHIGFREGEEGKTMGLAPYGEPDLYERLRPALTLGDDGSFEFLDPREVRRLLKLYVPARRPGGEILPRHKHAAYAAQAILQDIVTNTLQATVQLTHLEDVVYAGGVALNSVANESALQAVGPRRLYVPPNPGDAGHALGCALLGAYELAGWDPAADELPEYLGAGYTDDDLEKAARGSRFRLTRLPESETLVARSIANGYITARFEGSAEFGPRALGNRSILCDPRRPDMRDYLNAQVKRRESFRPFAPSVLLEHAAEWFELDDESPYMLRVVPVRAEKAQLVPAIVHVDGSARVQTVRRADNPAFWRLIDAFATLTSVPLLLNTSFNVNGQPIVETPADAVACFESTEIDLLVMGSWILSKRPLEELTSRLR